LCRTLRRVGSVRVPVPLRTIRKESLLRFDDHIGRPFKVGML
jgi:hypothetical protein